MDRSCGQAGSTTFWEGGGTLLMRLKPVCVSSTHPPRDCTGHQKNEKMTTLSSSLFLPSGSSALQPLLVFNAWDTKEKEAKCDYYAFFFLLFSGHHSIKYKKRSCPPFMLKGSSIDSLVCISVTFSLWQLHSTTYACFNSFFFLIFTPQMCTRSSTTECYQVNRQGERRRRTYLSVLPSFISTQRHGDLLPLPVDYSIVSFFFLIRSLLLLYCSLFFFHTDRETSQAKKKKRRKKKTARQRRSTTTTACSRCARIFTFWNRKSL